MQGGRYPKMTDLLKTPIMIWISAAIFNLVVLLPIIARFVSRVTVNKSVLGAVVAAPYLTLLGTVLMTVWGLCVSFKLAIIVAYRILNTSSILATVSFVANLRSSVTNLICKIGGDE